MQCHFITNAQTHTHVFVDYVCMNYKHFVVNAFSETQKIITDEVPFNGNFVYINIFWNTGLCFIFGVIRAVIACITSFSISWYATQIRFDWLSWACKMGCRFLGSQRTYYLSTNMRSQPPLHTFDAGSTVISTDIGVSIDSFENADIDNRKFIYISPATSSYEKSHFMPKGRT